jgi:hypothetical protein
MDRQERPDVATASEGLADCDWANRYRKAVADLHGPGPTPPGRPGQAAATRASGDTSSTVPASDILLPLVDGGAGEEPILTVTR